VTDTTPVARKTEHLYNEIIQARGMIMLPTVEGHFVGKDANLKAAYDKLITAVKIFGTVTEAPKQTSIHLEKNSGFAGVHPRKNSFNLEFRTSAPIEHPRITRELKLSAKRYEHTVKIESEADVDEQLISWLEEAYRLSK
jgi:hypothetical protein